MGYGFAWGYESPTRTPPPTKPAGFPYPWQSLDIDNWGLIFTQLGNKFCILLVNEFTKYIQNEISLEVACDTVRKELDKISEYMRFGSYTSIEEVCEAIFTTHDAI